jgi:hypothetical protein
MPDDESAAREAYGRVVARIESDVDEADREMALSVLGDTWGEAARFNGWSLESEGSE